MPARRIPPGGRPKSPPATFAVRPISPQLCHVPGKIFDALLVLLAWSTVATTLAGDAPGAWENLFDGKTLAGWAQSGFEGEADVKVVNPFQDGRGAIIIDKGTTLSGVTWTRGATLPRMNYEITLEAMKLGGTDFFCGLTFPVGKTACSF